MSLQLYQVDQKSYLLDFKSLNTQDHPDAKRVERMTRHAMHKSASSVSNTTDSASSSSSNLGMSQSPSSSANLGMSHLPLVVNIPRLPHKYF